MKKHKKPVTASVFLIFCFDSLHILHGCHVSGQGRFVISRRIELSIALCAPVDTVPDLVVDDELHDLLLYPIVFHRQDLAYLDIGRVEPNLLVIMEQLHRFGDTVIAYDSIELLWRKRLPDVLVNEVSDKAIVFIVGQASRDSDLILFAKG